MPSTQCNISTSVSVTLSVQYLHEKSLAEYIIYNIYFIYKTESVCLCLMNADVLYYVTLQSEYMYNYYSFANDFSYGWTFPSISNSIWQNSDSALVEQDCK